ncbi:MAG: nuclear transport factor 2 family protein [Actinomycetota bacterium]|nr:nuclear transport factor 2 family protein [Actinomycetota bacterium]
MDRLTDEDLVQDLADRLDVEAVANRYALALDRRDWAAIGRLFTDDARIEVVDVGTGEGPDGITELVRAILQPLDASQHVNGNHLVAVRGDQATHSSYTIAQHVRHGLPNGDLCLIGARYEDRLLRTPGGWRFAYRRVTVLWMQGNPSVVGRS